MRKYTENQLWTSTPTCREAYIFEHFNAMIAARLELLLAYAKEPFAGFVIVNTNHDGIRQVTSFGKSGLYSMRIESECAPDAGYYCLSKVDEDSACFTAIDMQKVKEPNITVPRENCPSGRIKLDGSPGRGALLAKLARETPGIIDLMAVNALYDGTWCWTMNDEKSPIILTCDETGDVAASMPFVIPLQQIR